MESGKHLLLIAVLPLLVRCQKPQVLMVPTFKMAFIGDTVYLKCNPSANSVTWHKRNGEQIVGADILKVEIKNSNDGGLFWCEISGTKSDPVSVNVMESGLSASLTIETGYQNMWKGGAVILKLENKDGLKGWRCWVYRGGESRKMVSLKLEGVNNSMVFQTADLNVNETIYWCTDEGQTHRSNQVILITSDPWEPPKPPEKEGKLGMVLGILLVLVGMLVVIVVIVVVGLRRRRRSDGVRIYEDVALRSKERGDDKYETLQKASGREREYDTLAGASGGEPKGGEYEALKKGEMKEEVYHTLGVEGAAGGEGGYEALKKGKMKEEVYHTLRVEGAAGGEGGYEAGRKDKPSESATADE